MENKNNLLKKAIKLNEEKKWSEVDSLLTDKLLESYNDIELYAEKTQALWNLKKKEECEIIINKGYLLNPNNAKINNYLGNLYKDKEEYQKAENHYLKAIELDLYYASPYNGLGNLYKAKKEYEKAEKHYKMAMELEPNNAIIYNNLGIFYKHQLDLKKAENYYLKAIELDPNYYPVYNNLGIFYYDKKNYEKAEEEYQKSIKIKSDFPLPYYNLALIYFLRNEYENAKENLEKYLKLKINENDYFVDFAKSRIEEIDNILESKQYEKINNITSKIKELLCFKKGHVTHYTSISVARYLILNETLFRLSEGAFLNDTSEGTILFKYLDFDSTTQNNCGPNASIFSKKPFIGSFVNHSKNNDLTLWRMYGKENLEEAKGCSITIDIDELKGSIKQKLKTNNEDLKNFEELEFYKVAYLNDGKFTFSEAKAAEITKLNKFMKEIKLEVIAFKDKKDKKPDETLKIIELLNEVAYLFKNAEYQYENEVRLVMKEANGFDKIVDLDLTPPRPPKVYIELVPILSMIKEITIGPKVERADEWASAFHYHFATKGFKPEINISNLPFK
ncbi:MAG: tetratricopeptide repeat protein [Flavobacterium sp.]|uniref:tetratricopeptide repeat protein n=1 Tax=Flavobacterium sp. TaxID=239 RepID=UPI003265C6ED